MSDVSIREMLEAGAHFGHQTHRWNPRMKPFIYGARNGIHIIDLQKTALLCQTACEFLTQLVAEGGEVLIVGTKRQAQPIVEEEAKRAGMFYVSNRWLGGTLTNFRTIRASIERLKDLEKKRDEKGLEGLTKKEKLGVERQIIKLTRALGGIKEMSRLPAAVFIVDPFHEEIALGEAKRLKIPVIAVADTNCNPEGIDYLIPGNDDATRSVKFFTTKIADAFLAGVARRAEGVRDRLDPREEGQRPKEAPGGKGKAYVTLPEAYETKVEGAYKGEQAAAEVPSKENQT